MNLRVRPLPLRFGRDVISVLSALLCSATASERERGLSCSALLCLTACLSPSPRPNWSAWSVSVCLSVCLSVCVSYKNRQNRTEEIERRRGQVQLQLQLHTHSVSQSLPPSPLHFASETESACGCGCGCDRLEEHCWWWRWRRQKSLSRAIVEGGSDRDTIEN